MFKAIKDNKIIAISDTDSEFKFLVKDSVAEDSEHTCEDYAQYNGEYLLKDDIHPTQEEHEVLRADAYREEVDPITCHIDRLKDEENPDEDRIAELNAERDTKVQEIKERYPYPEEYQS